VKSGFYQGAPDGGMTKKKENQSGGVSGVVETKKVNRIGMNQITARKTQRALPMLRKTSMWETTSQNKQQTWGRRNKDNKR